MTTQQPIEMPVISGQRPADASGHVETAGLTDIGRARSRNEDSYLIATLQRSMVIHDASPPGAHGWVPGETAGTLLVIADGMGGQGSGDVASQVAVNTTVGYLLNVMPWVAAGPNVASRDSAPSLWSVREQLSTALVAGDSTVKAVGAQAGSPRMGTTLTMALIQFPNLYVAHVGDTRGYLFRGRKLSQLTTDHTVAQQIAERDPNFLELHSALHNMLWNSLGGSDDVARPQLSKVPLAPGDFILLCSDGLTKHVKDAEISEVLASSATLEARCTELVRRANEAGGTDNITVLIASIR